MFSGLVAAIVAAPMSLYLAANYTTNFENVTFSVGQNIIDAILGPPISEGTRSDILGKLVVFWIVYLLIRLPQKTKVFDHLGRNPLHY